MTLEELKDLHEKFKLMPIPEVSGKQRRILEFQKLLETGQVYIPDRCEVEYIILGVDISKDKDTNTLKPL